MKTISDIFDTIGSLVIWVIVAFILFGFANMARAQELTLEQRIVAHTILGEARGEGEAGMYGVACVIKQRMINRKMSAKEVCFEDNQFSFWNVDNANRANVRRLMVEDKAKVVKYAKRLAIHLNDLDRSYVKNADHYCHVNINNYWTRKSKSVVVIKKHKYFRLR